MHINEKNNNGICTKREEHLQNKHYASDIRNILQHNKRFKLTLTIWHYTFNNN